MNDGGQSYGYPKSVRFDIAEGDQPAYRRAADFLNVDEVEITCVQHEYGIFGGKAGSHVLALRELRMRSRYESSNTISRSSRFSPGPVQEVGRLVIWIDK
jgi:hypothetical protein